MVLYTVMSEAQIAAVTKEILQVLLNIWKSGPDIKYLIHSMTMVSIGFVPVKDGIGC